MLLHEAGLLAGQDESVLSDLYAVWRLKRLTYQGHEFLEMIRDTEVWRRTKAGAGRTGVGSIGVLMELGKAYGKQTLKEHLRIEHSLSLGEAEIRRRRCLRT